MFAITPYTANAHRIVRRSAKTCEEWQACTVIGIDATGDEPEYVIEVRAPDGSFYLEKTTLVRKPAPCSA